MVDNRGISPLGSTYFKSDNASANKMSDEKQGQGGEYFAQEMQEEEMEYDNHQNNYQDRSAQLRASLNGLAMANAGSIMLMKTLKKNMDPKDKTNKTKNEKQNQNSSQETDEEIYE